MKGSCDPQMVFENDTIQLQSGMLIFKHLHKAVLLKGKSLGLIWCLLHNINDKHSIIVHLWGNSRGKNYENNYKQLVHSLREKLVSQGLPRDLLITLPQYGICLDRDLLSLGQHCPINRDFFTRDQAAYL